MLYSASLVIFFITSRFRAPLWPVLILFSSVAFHRIHQWLKAKKILFGAIASILPTIVAALLILGNKKIIQAQYFENMVLIYEKLDDNKSVINELSDQLLLYPAAHDAQWKLAYYLQKEGLKEEALEKLDDLLRAVGDQPQVLRSAGLLDLELGNRERAEIRLRRYLELSPHAPDSVEIERIISGPGSR